MFQSFDIKSKPEQAQSRVAALRALLRQENLDGFLVPHADEYQSEYLPPCAERLEWLTGFGGSAGYALILRRQAVLFIDGRYHLQARQQTDSSIFAYADISAFGQRAWWQHYLSHAAEGETPASDALRIGFDPWLHSMAETENLRAALKPLGHLQAVSENLADKIWHDRPSAPCGKISAQPLQWTGRAAADKAAHIRAETRALGAEFCLLTEPAAIAWAFNIRGSDVAHNPVALGFALIPAADSVSKHDAAAAAEFSPTPAPPLLPQKQAMLFMCGAPGDAESLPELANIAQFLPRENLAAVIKSHARQNAVFMADKHKTAEAFRLQIEAEGGKIITADNPCLLPRAVKTEAECAGSRQAHLCDGVAVTRFLAWLERQRAEYGAESLDEIGAAARLEHFRAETALSMGSRLEDISFDTISAAGAHGAIIHYRVTRATNSLFQEGQLYLLDSGGQYRCGTTDITRTMAIGAAAQEQKRCFTLVLKGMIALSMARFPQGICGRDLDCLARMPLWKNGMDYAHGTGHGAGSFLNVHEGPQNISRRGEQELYAGMIISNEPGYYREGAFGIRIENLLLVRKADAAGGAGGEEMPMLYFETLTLCPIDRSLIVPSLLSAEELAWLNAYHARVYAQLAPFLSERDKAWLSAAAARL